MRVCIEIRGDILRRFDSTTAGIVSTHIWKPCLAKNPSNFPPSRRPGSTGSKNSVMASLFIGDFIRNWVKESGFSSKRKIAAKEYAKLYETFNASEFRLPRQLPGWPGKAACAYAVLTTRHHEGFSLYDTRGLFQIRRGPLTGQTGPSAGIYGSLPSRRHHPVFLPYDVGLALGLGAVQSAEIQRVPGLSACLGENPLPELRSHWRAMV